MTKSIYFVPRKYNGLIDSHYSIKINEKEYADIARYQIGDEIRIIFPVPQYLTSAIKEGRWHDVCLFDGEKASIPFKVVKRVHTLIWHELGQLRELTCQIYVKAISGAWEDVFLATAKGEVPDWAKHHYEEHKEL